MNKQALKHIYFWTFYFLANSLFGFYVMQSLAPKSNDIDLIVQALTMNLALLAPKILFTYFVFYFSIPAALEKNFSNAANLLFTFLTLFVLVVIRQFCARLVLLHYPNFYTEKNVTYDSMFTLVQLLVGLRDLGFICGIAITLKLFKTQLSNLKTDKVFFTANLENELEFLKNQPNPLFLSTTLTNIYALASKKSDLAPELIMKLSKFIRFMLYESPKSQITIAKEINMLEDFIEIEKVRFSKKIEVSFAKEIDNYNKLITPLILLPFIENAFKHGPGEMVSEPFVNISIILKDGYLKLNVTNSKDKGEVGKVHEKIGMGNVRRQLELLYNEFELAYQNLSNSFKMNLSINLNKNVNL